MTESEQEQTNLAIHILQNKAGVANKIMDLLETNLRLLHAVLWLLLISMILAILVIGKDFLIPFTFAVDDSFQLEFSENGKIRFYKADAAILSGGNPYEISHPYNFDEISVLSFIQSADVMWFFHEDQPPQKLSRLADDNWVLAEADFTGGPFIRQNVEEAITITSSAVTGSVTLTASSPIFDAGHVGSLWKLEEKDGNGVDTWFGGVDSAGADVAYNNGDKARAGGNVYESTSASPTDAGVNSLVHLEGDVSSGKGKVSWLYLHSGFGVVEITGFTSTTQVTATVIKRLPNQMVGTPTFKWSEGSWSAFRGYPSVAAWYEQRMMVAATASQPTTVWGSNGGDFENFEEGIEDNRAVNYTLVSRNNQVNRIVWMVESARLLPCTDQK